MLAYVAICLTTMCSFMNYFALFVILFVLTIVGLCFFQTEIWDKFIFNLIKKYNKNIEADEIYPIFKYGNHYIFDNWNVFPVIDTNKSYVTLNEDSVKFSNFVLCINNKISYI